MPNKINNSYSTASLTQKQKKGLEYFSARVKKLLGKKLIELKLYGSRARGDARPDSDTDVLIAAKNITKRDEEKILDLEIMAIKKYDMRISARVMKKKQYEFEKNLPSLFMQFVAHEGIDL